MIKKSVKYKISKNKRTIYIVNVGLPGQLRKKEMQFENLNTAKQYSIKEAKKTKQPVFLSKNINLGFFEYN